MPTRSMLDHSISTPMSTCFFRRPLKFYPLEEESVGLKQKIGCLFLLWPLVLLSAFIGFALCSTHLFKPLTVSPLLLLGGSQHQGSGSVVSSVPCQPQIQRSCDLGTGRWMRDSRGPAYTSCAARPESKNCAKFGKDMDYTNWTWKPNDCELPPFDAQAFLDRVRGKKMVFVGDSVARNQFDSLVCLLSQIESPKSIYKDQDDRFRTWHFSSHNFTLAVLWSRYLISASERLINSSAYDAYNLFMDKIDPSWKNALTEGIDFLIISSGHWFFKVNHLYDKNTLIGCVFCSEPNVTNISVETAVQKAFRTTLEFLLNCKTCDGVTVFVRTFSPAHYERGSWNNGGRCNRTRPLKEEDTVVSGTHWDISRLQLEEVRRVSREQSSGRKLKFVPLDITRAMFMRADGHPDSHWGNKWGNGYHDCVHWCLPGPIDFWNQILFAEVDRLICSL